MTRRLPSLRALQVFEAASRLGSFKQAALELHVTPAAVSRQIKELELVLGVHLFERRNRKVTMSNRGLRYASVIGRTFEEIAAATAELTETPKKVTRLTLLVDREFAVRWLLPNLRDFNERHPGIDLEIIPAAEIAELPSQGPGAAITYRKIAQRGVQQEHLLALHAFPVCAPNLLTAERTLKVPSDLRHFRLLHDRSTECWKRWLAAAGAADINWSLGHIVHESSLAIAGSLAEEGIAIGDTLLALHELESGRLIKPFKLVIPTGSYYLARWMNAEPNLPLDLFYEWLIPQCAQQQIRCDKWC